MKKEFTKDQYEAHGYQNAVGGGLVAAVAMALLWAFVAFKPVSPPTCDEMRKTDAYHMGYREGERKGSQDGWEDAETAWKRYACKNGKAEYGVNKLTGAVEFKWK